MPANVITDKQKLEMIIGKYTPDFFSGPHPENEYTYLFDGNFGMNECCCPGITGASCGLGDIYFQALQYKIGILRSDEQEIKTFWNKFYLFFYSDAKRGHSIVGEKWYENDDRFYRTRLFWRGEPVADTVTSFSGPHFVVANGDYIALNVLDNSENFALVVYFRHEKLDIGNCIGPDSETYFFSTGPYAASIDFDENVISYWFEGKKFAVRPKPELTPTPSSLLSVVQTSIGWYLTLQDAFYFENQMISTRNPPPNRYSAHNIIGTYDNATATIYEKNAELGGYPFTEKKTFYKGAEKVGENTATNSWSASGNEYYNFSTKEFGSFRGVIGVDGIQTCAVYATCGRFAFFSAVNGENLSLILFDGQEIARGPSVINSAYRDRLFCGCVPAYDGSDDYFYYGMELESQRKIFYDGKYVTDSLTSSGSETHGLGYLCFRGVFLWKNSVLLKDNNLGGYEACQNSGVVTTHTTSGKWETITMYGNGNLIMKNPPNVFDLCCNGRNMKYDEDRLRCTTYDGTFGVMRFDCQSFVRLS